MSGKKGKKRGRPAFAPTQGERDLVKRLVGLGIPLREVAARIRKGIAYETLRPTLRVGRCGIRTVPPIR